MPSPTQTKTTSHMRANLEHLKNHVPYPTNRAGVVKACNDMADVNPSDREWFNNAIPEGDYKNANDVLKALLNKV